MSVADRNAKRREQRLRASGPAFGRLTKTQQREVLSLRGHAATKRLIELDAERRGKVRDRSRKRRIQAKALAYSKLDPYERSARHGDVSPVDPFEAQIFWKAYKKVTT